MKEEYRIPTPEDWYPTYDDGTVEVSVFIMDNNTVRTCVWGGDDYGLERDEKFENKADAKTMYRKRIREVQEWKTVTKDMLKDLGFVNS